MNDTATTNRTLGFRSRMEARLALLLEQLRADPATATGAAASRAPSVQELTSTLEQRVVPLVQRLVEGRMMQQATLDRAWLARHWSLLDHDHAASPSLQALLRQLAAIEASSHKSPYPPFWPLEVSAADVVEALESTRDGEASLVAEALRKGLLFKKTEDESLGADLGLHIQDTAQFTPAPSSADPLERALARWPLLECARVVAACKMVVRDLRKPVIAIDAGKVHHELMGGWSRVAKDQQVHLTARPDRVELMLPGIEHKPALLTLPLDGERLSQAFVEAIKEWRSFLGLRHWIALQSLFSIQGRREGRVLWKLEDHLDALGVSKRWREDPENRAAVVREVSLLTKMQLVVYRPDGTVRARHNVLLTTGEIDVEREGQWYLEGLELTMHPWLYNGVRDQKTGQLGKHWHPVPPELAKVDHDKFRHALVLGLMLPIRWKWAWARHGIDVLTIEAGHLLDLACIQRSAHDPRRAWDALERSFEELKRINLLGYVEWEGTPRTLAAQLRLYPADWLLDRTLQGLHPIEKALPPSLPTKGSELIIWRKARGWTQTELAHKVGVSERTVRNAETSPDKLLGRALTQALRAKKAEALVQEASLGEAPEPDSTRVR